MKTLRLFLLLAFLTGIVYPVFITLVAQVSFKDKADGSLVGNSGSSLIAQKFSSAKYFWPRPSAVDYNTLASGGSNLGPISPALQKQVLERQALYKGQVVLGEVPSELLYASASGLDPHISPKAAFIQIDRVGVARKMPREVLIALVNRHIEKRPFGKPCVNVLLLNCALDQVQNGR